MLIRATIVAAAATLCPSLFGLSVKVLSVDHKSGDVVLLMPMHNTRIIAQLPPDEPEIRVRAKGFYEARIEPGTVDTVKRNVLRVEIPGRRPVRFRIRKIAFLD